MAVGRLRRGGDAGLAVLVILNSASTRSFHSCRGYLSAYYDDFPELSTLPPLAGRLPRPIGPSGILGLESHCGDSGRIGLSYQDFGSFLS